MAWAPEITVVEAIANLDLHFPLLNGMLSQIGGCFSAQDLSIVNLMHCSSDTIRLYTPDTGHAPIVGIFMSTLDDKRPSELEDELKNLHTDKHIQNAANNHATQSSRVRSNVMEVEQYASPVLCFSGTGVGRFRNNIQSL